MTAVRIALVGLGAIGLEAHLPALLRSPDVEVTALVDPDPQRRRLANAIAPGVPVFADLDAVLAEGASAAVVLATPPWITTGLIRQSLASGLFCLAEKPLGVDSATIRTLLDLPVDQQARLQVGLTYRHDPAMAMLRSWISEDELGWPLLIRAHIYDEPRRTETSDYTRRILATIEHGPPIIHEGGHVFDWLIYLLGGPPDSVKDAWQLRTEPGLRNPTINGARLTWPDAAIAVVEIGWWTSAQPPCTLSVLGSKGYAELDCATFRLQRHGSAGRTVVEFPGERTSRSFDRQLARFAELASGTRKTAEPGLAAGLATMELSERIVAMAARDGQPADRVSGQAAGR